MELDKLIKHVHHNTVNTEIKIVLDRLYFNNKDYLHLLKKSIINRNFKK
jgi:hypothetical protein